MNFGIKLALLTALLIGIAVVGPGFCVTQLKSTQTSLATSESQMVRPGIIKVHTAHGVVTLPGTAYSWDDVENAIFVADSIADLQIAIGGVPSQISYD